VDRLDASEDVSSHAFIVFQARILSTTSLDIVGWGTFAGSDNKTLPFPDSGWGTATEGKFSKSYLRNLVVHFSFPSSILIISHPT
jgi:hypothetical protein